MQYRIMDCLSIYLSPSDCSLVLFGAFQHLYTLETGLDGYTAEDDSHAQPLTSSEAVIEDDDAEEHREQLPRDGDHDERQ